MIQASSVVGRSVFVLIATALCGAAVVAQVPKSAKRSSKWIVPAFRVYYGENHAHGAYAAASVIAELQAKGFECIADSAPVKGSKIVRGSSKPEDASRLRAFGERVRGDSTTDDTILVGEISRSDIFSSWSGERRHGVEMRIIAYDTASGLPVAGIVRRDESSVYTSETEETSFMKAVQRVAVVGAKALLEQQPPTATLLNTTVNVPLINRGEADGYWAGTPVMVVRNGREVIGRAHVSVAEADQAELVFDRVERAFSPGDRVRALFRPLLDQGALPAGTAVRPE